MRAGLSVIVWMISPDRVSGKTLNLSEKWLWFRCWSRESKMERRILDENFRGRIIIEQMRKLCGQYLDLLIKLPYTQWFRYTMQWLQIPMWTRSIFTLLFNNFSDFGILEKFLLRWMANLARLLGKDSIFAGCRHIANGINKVLSVWRVKARWVAINADVNAKCWVQKWVSSLSRSEGNWYQQ